MEALVSDYLAMLDLELSGEPYSKAERRRALMTQLEGRSEASIEYKHRNASAVLLELGLPYIDGYKPAWNYQELVLEVMRSRLHAAGDLLERVRSEVLRPAALPATDDLLARLVDRPSDRPPPQYGAGRERHFPVAPNYLGMEARNSSLGAAGEAFVLNFERARLIAAGRERLAAQVEQVSSTRGDHLGFDILSYEADSRERLIEVKTTAFGPFTPFFVSANQVTRSQELRERYHVYRLFRFRRDPRLFTLPGAIEENVELRAREYSAHLR